MAKREFRNYGLNKKQVMDKYDMYDLVYELMKYDDELRCAMYDAYNEGRGVSSNEDIDAVDVGYLIQKYLRYKREVAGVVDEPVI